MVLSTLVRTCGTPPAAGTRRNPLLLSLKRRSCRRFPTCRQEEYLRWDRSVWAGPPCTEIRFRVLSMPLPNAIHWPSGGEERRDGAFRAPNERRLQLSADAQIEPSVRRRARLGGWRASIDQVRTVARHRDGASCRKNAGGASAGVVMTKRSTGAGRGRLMLHTTPAAASPPTMNMPMAHGSTIGQRARGTGIGPDAAIGRAGLGASNAPASASRTADMSRTRFLGSFCRQTRSV